MLNAHARGGSSSGGRIIIILFSVLCPAARAVVSRGTRSAAGSSLPYADIQPAGSLLLLNQSINLIVQAA
jgi:hypothetical protein